MIKVGLFGFGRIGRAITRLIFDNDDIKLKFICDENPSFENIAYLLQYDSTYGKFKYDVSLKQNNLLINDGQINLYKKSDLEKINFNEVDFIIDATGSIVLNKKLRLLLDGLDTKLIQTNSPNDGTKKIIMGVNEKELLKTDKFIASSICDANACATVLAAMNNIDNIESGSITTLHPWLGYQNTLDGPSKMFSVENEIYENFGLGRSSNDNLIPKLTSCVSAIEAVYPQIKNRIEGMSVRVPTKIVSSAFIYLKLKVKQSVEDIHQSIYESEQQKNGYLDISNEHLVSSDFIGSKKNAVFDSRWTHINKTHLMRMFIWYDNEFGYSSNVIRLINYWSIMLMNK